MPGVFALPRADHESNGRCCRWNVRRR